MRNHEKHENLGAAFAATKPLIFNHEWTRMHTNFLQSTENTEETECLAADADKIRRILVCI